MKPKPLFLSIGTVTTAALCVLIHWQLAWHWLLAYLVAVNVVTFVLYGYDKFSAVRRGLRVPEVVLHTLAFVGGTLGAIAAQGFFRHKTAKKSFRVVFWVLVVAQAALVIWAMNSF